MATWDDVTDRVPMYISQTVDRQDGHLVTPEEFNALFTLLITQGDEHTAAIVELVEALSDILLEDGNAAENITLDLETYNEPDVASAIQRIYNEFYAYTSTNYSNSYIDTLLTNLLSQAEGMVNALSADITSTIGSDVDDLKYDVTILESKIDYKISETDAEILVQFDRPVIMNVSVSYLGWQANVVGTYEYYNDVSIGSLGITNSTHDVDINFIGDAIALAEEAGVYPYTVVGDGYVRLYAKEIPSNTMSAEAKITKVWRL